MTTIFLVRHATHDRIGRYLDGRRPGVHLSEAGQRQAERLAHRLADEHIEAIYASPLERTMETAAPIAAALDLTVAIDPALLEIDFGEWSGRTFEELAPLDAWHRWNSARSTAPTPAGDTMRAAQSRIVDFIDMQRHAKPKTTFVIVGHGDPLKAAIAFVLGLSLDALPRFDIAPASLSRIEIADGGARVVTLNEIVPE